jgi:hypothetical protein
VTSNQALFVPEELISQIHSLRSDLTNFEQSSFAVNRKNFADVAKGLKDLGAVASQILSASATWQRALDERDEEIRKLRSGYDLEVFRRFISRFARVRLAIDHFQSDPPIKELEQISRLLDDAFDECGVERFAPQIGEDYRSAAGVEDNPKRIASSNPEDAYRIVETIAPGFRSRSTTNPTILVPARVSIYVHQGSV